MRYRIRKRLIYRDSAWSGGYDCIMYLAERSVILFGKVIMWWPVINAHWRFKKTEARIDIRGDYCLRKAMQHDE